MEPPRREPVGTGDASSSLRDRRAGAERKQLQIQVGRQSKEPVFRALKAEEGISSLYDVDTNAYQTFENRGVYPARFKADGTECVVKMRRKKNPADDRAFIEVLRRLMTLPGHLNVLTFRELLEDEYTFYMVMDKCNSGELFSLLLTEAEISERECKRIMREILTGVNVLHKNGLVHRDIKPENLLLHQEDPKSPKSPKNVKLIDFDTSSHWEPSSPKAKHIVGTHGYIAPEAYLGDYTPKSDLWSCGVVFYALMTGSMPYRNSLFDQAEGMSGSVGKGIEKMHGVLADQLVDFDCEPWGSFPLARDLCQRLMAFDPRDRIESAEASLAHEWLRPRSSQGSRRGSSPRLPQSDPLRPA